MGILGRYIALAWLKMVGLCLGSFISLYLVLDMMDKIPRFLKAGGALPDIFVFFLYKIPEMVGQTAPFSLLMATLLTLGILSRNSEIIAMRSCGVSLPRIAQPMLLLGAAASLLLLFNAEVVVPDSYLQMDYIERVKIKKQGENAVFRRNNIWFRSDAQIVQAQLFDPPSKTLGGVVVWTLDKDMNPVSRIDATKASYREGVWRLTDAVVKDFSGGHGFVQKQVAQMDLPLKLKVDDLKVLDNNADNLSYQQLREYAENLAKGGYHAYRYQTMMHAKFSAPVAAFIMVLLGIPFAIKNSRSGGIALGIGASVAIGFAFFVVNAVLLSYGRSGVIPPLLAAWSANLIFSVGGIWLALKVKN